MNCTQGNKRYSRKMHVVPQDFQPITTAIVDIPTIANYVTTHLVDAHRKYTVVYLGAGDAVYETQLSEALRNDGVCIECELYVERQVSSNMLVVLQDYASTVLKPGQMTPAIVFSHADLIVELESVEALLIVGIHAAQSFACAQDLYAFHALACMCAQFADERKLHPSYHNFVTATMPMQGIVLDLGAGTKVFKQHWWDVACSAITATGARMLLTGTQAEIGK